MPVRRLCFEGPEEELNRTENLQPCVMTVCWAAYEIWRESYGMEDVRVMAGHSLGEFTALAAAGAISWETALLLVKERGRIMAEATRTQPGGMLAIVGLDEAEVEAIRTRASKLGRLYVANRNADVQFVLSGELPAIRRAEKLPLFGGVHPAGKPQVPPETRTFNAAFADGHVKVFRLGYKQPSWDPNHDMNWFLQEKSNCDLGNDYDP